MNSIVPLYVVSSLPLIHIQGYFIFLLLSSTFHVHFVKLCNIIVISCLFLHFGFKNQ